MLRNEKITEMRYSLHKKYEKLYLQLINLHTEIQNRLSSENNKTSWFIFNDNNQRNSSHN